MQSWRCSCRVVKGERKLYKVTTTVLLFLPYEDPPRVLTLFLLMFYIRQRGLHTYTHTHSRGEYGGNNPKGLPRIEKATIRRQDALHLLIHFGWVSLCTDRFGTGREKEEKEEKRKEGRLKVAAWKSNRGVSFCIYTQSKENSLSYLRFEQSSTSRSGPTVIYQPLLSRP